MANIEKRRKQRVIIPIAIIAGSVLLLAGIIIALVLFISHNKHKTHEADPEPTVSITEQVTEEPAPTDTPAPTAAATPAPTETPAVTARPDQTEDPDHAPERVTDALSSAYFEIEVKNGRIKLECLISFVNNTDTVFYSGSFDVCGLSAKTATCGGVSAKFSYDENGLLVVPFVDELRTGESCTLYFELEGAFDSEAGVTLPVFGYDTPYLLSAAITSDVSLASEGASLKLGSVDSAYHYTINKKTVRTVTIRPVS